jgi:hypothetical protein
VLTALRSSRASMTNFFKVSASIAAAHLGGNND